MNRVVVSGVTPEDVAEWLKDTISEDIHEAIESGSMSGELKIRYTMSLKLEME